MENSESSIQNFLVILSIAVFILLYRAKYVLQRRSQLTITIISSTLAKVPTKMLTQ